MRLSRDKMNKLAHTIADTLADLPNVDFIEDRNTIRQEIRRLLEELLKEEAKIDASADAFLVTTVDERFEAFELVVVDGAEEFVDDVILEDAVSVGQSKDGILRFQPADPRYRLCAGIDKPNQAQTHGLALLDQRGEFAGILAETDDQAIVEPLQLVSQAPAAAEQNHSEIE